MGNELFNSIVSKVAVHVPTFAKAIVESALEKMRVSPWKVTPVQMKKALDEYIVPKIRSYTKQSKQVELMVGGIKPSSKLSSIFNDKI